MNGHPQYADALALYALGALDNAQELAELEAHLGTCGECRRELEALRADAALLAFSTVGPKPPERARQRLLGAIAAEPRAERRKGRPIVVGRLRPRWLSFAPIAVMLLLAVFSLLLGINLRNVQRELRHAREENRQMRDQLAEARHAQEILAMLTDPSAMRVKLVSTPQTRPQPLIQTIYKRENGHILMMANNLAPLPPNKVYELWLLPANGHAPMPAGTFKPDAGGNGMMMHPMEAAGIDAKGFAVTIEPENGSQTPTLPIVMAPAS
ncbi:MAG TPA: anti-sigma factor [Candidatus Angelobacter sp.]|nr:anti-sigma factor [Candidatus Angelobacter sp.]